MENKTIKIVSTIVFAIAAVILIYWIGIPAINTLNMSVRDFRIMDGIWGSQFVGYANYLYLFNSPLFPSLLPNSLIIFLGSTILAVAIAFPAALAVGGIKKGKTRSAATIALLLPAFIPDAIIAFLTFNFAPSMALVTPFSYRVVIILLSVIQPAAVCAFVGACATGLYNDSGKKPFRGASVGVFIGIAATLIRFLSSNLELSTLLSNPLVLSVAQTFDSFAYQESVLFLRFNLASPAWVFKTVLQVLVALAVSFVVFECVKTGIAEDSKDSTMSDKNGNNAKVIVGILFAALFVASLLLPMLYSGSYGILPTRIRYALGNSILTTAISTVLYVALMLALTLKLCASLHNKAAIMFVLVLVAVANNVAGEFLYAQNTGLTNTHLAVILSSAINITFVLPIAYLARLRNPIISEVSDVVRSLLPYLIAFVGLFVATIWGNSFNQMLHLHQGDLFGVSLLLRMMLFAGGEPAQLSLLLLVAIPVLLVAAVTVFLFVILDRHNSSEVA